MKQQSFRWARIAVAALAMGSFGLALGGCTTARIPVTGLEVPLPDIPLPAMLRGENDLRSRSWTKAFEILHERMKREYAYSAVKGIDWDALHTRFAAEVAAAEETKDREGWYRALRGYVHSIPDGNVQIDANEDLRVAEEGASAGMALAQLADGSVVVCGLLPGGPAEEAGIDWGATVTSWNDKPVVEALEKTSIFWADATAATPAMRREQQLTWLPRGGVGDSCRITFKNPGAAAEMTVTLERVADDYETLALYRPLWEPVELFSSPVSSKTLSGGYRYIRVAAIAPTLSTPFPQRDFRAAVRAAIDADVPGLILDLRGTQGGDASLVPKMLASFVEEPTVLEVPGVWDDKLATFVVKAEDPVMVEPQLPAYTGHVIVLVDGYTMGPAESVARFLQARESIEICGLTGTYGSPGVPTVELNLPGGYMIFYPDRQSLDENGNPLGVTDQAGAGNIQPDIAVPLDEPVLQSIFSEGADSLLEKALEVLGG